MLSYATEAQWPGVLRQLKLTACPHCKRTGALILHGKLYGFDGTGSRQSVRGRRVFCNNRKKRHAGCGRTFVVWASDRLKHACLGTASLWKFLKGAIDLDSKAAALRSLNLDLSASSAYRLWTRFLRGQSRIRTLLHRICLPPESPGACPAAQTIAHLEKAFARSHCPIEAFQQHFQVSFT